MRMRDVLSASSDSLLRWPESTERILEYNPWNITLALALRLDTVFTGWALLAALDAPFAACCDI